MIFDIAIIGAGASGLMFASNVNKKKFENICLIDANSKIGEKIRISGGAKCNITNDLVSQKNYLGDRDFVKELLNNFSKDDLLAFLNKNGVFPKINPKIVKGTYFCKSSKDVIEMFEKLTSHIKKFLNTKVEDITFENGIYKIKTQRKVIEAKKVVLSSGGLSYPSLGASNLAFKTAEKFNHTIEKLEPALVGFTSQKDEFWFKKLSGVSLNVVSYVDAKKFEGSFLFAHKGCTGPVILSSSLYWKKGKLAIDFLPKQKIENFLSGNKKISTSLPFPKRFIQEFLLAKEIEDKAVSSLKKEEIEILKSLNYYEFSPAGNFGYSKAEVTKGGVNSSEINHKTFESLKQNNLYFLGECLNITGELGGFNFQYAFSSAYTCAKNIK